VAGAGGRVLERRRRRGEWVGGGLVLLVLGRLGLGGRMGIVGIGVAVGGGERRWVCRRWGLVRIGMQWGWGFGCWWGLM
jgi:hypothetical protein